MSSILVVGAHPDYQNSIANRAILDEFAKLVPDAEIIKLAELYPDFQIDSAREQKRLSSAEMIIFDYPFWWYGEPSLLRRYMERVFLRGWAYGVQGRPLAGKNLVVSFTVGGSEADYQPDGPVKYIMELFLPPIIATARFTGMVYRGAIYSYDMACYNPEDLARKAAVEAAGREQARRLKERVAQFVYV